MSRVGDLRITIVLVLCAGYFAALAAYGTVRPVDGDEGYYATAARLVGEGRKPYTDFFYPQAPLLPPVYAVPHRLVPGSLQALRVFSASCGALAALLWALRFASRRDRRDKTDLAVALALLLLNPYWFSWHVTVKTYAVADLLVTTALLGLRPAIRGHRPEWYALVGGALGAAAAVRLLYAPVAGVLVAWACVRTHRSRMSRAALLQLGVGLLAGFSPALWSLLRNPEGFWFNNVGYHLLRSDPAEPWIRILGAIRFAIVAMWERPYLGLLAAVGAVGAAAVLRRDRDDRPYGAVVLLLLAAFVVASLAPRPLYHQYLAAPLVPFLLPYLAPGIERLRGWQRGLPWLAAALAVALFSAHVRGELEAGRSESDWNTANYESVAASIERLSRPDEVVLSFWPGYVFESGRSYLPGLENHFAFRISEKIDAATRRRFHVPGKEDVFGAVARREPRVVVIGAWMKDFRRNLSDLELQEFAERLRAGYRTERRIGDVWVLQRNEGRPATEEPAGPDGLR